MSKRATLGTTLAVLAIIVLLLIAAQMKFDPNFIDENWTGTPLPPCFVNANACVGHILGTDELGRDLLARIGRGGEVTLGVSLVAVILEVTFGISFGALARYGGTVLKFVITRIGEGISCFPPWPFLVGIVFLVTPPGKATLSPGLLAAITAMLFSPQIARLIEADAGSIGVVSAVANQAARDYSRIIMVLATVDYFGLGVQPPTPTWGNMLRNLGESVSTGWWSVVFPLLSIFAATLTIEIMRRRLLAPPSGAANGTDIGR